MSRKLSIRIQHLKINFHTKMRMIAFDVKQHLLRLTCNLGSILRVILANCFQLVVCSLHQYVHVHSIIILCWRTGRARILEPNFHIYQCLCQISQFHTLTVCKYCLFQKIATIGKFKGSNIHNYIYIYNIYI